MSRVTLIKAVADHLAKQRKRALSVGGVCQYKAPDGAMCAIGGILPPELYSFQIEGLGVNLLLDKPDRSSGNVARSAVANYLREQIPEVPVTAQKLVLREIQRYHDRQDEESYDHHICAYGDLTDDQFSDIIYYELMNRTARQLQEHHES